jgi:predicted alpha/beta hydrolase
MQVSVTFRGTRNGLTADLERLCGPGSLLSGLSARGIALGVHEWRGTGAHPARPSRRHDWGYRELLVEDIPATRSALSAAHPGLPLLYGGHSIGAQFAVMAAALRRFIARVPVRTGAQPEPAAGDGR